MFEVVRGERFMDEEADIKPQKNNPFEEEVETCVVVEKQSMCSICEGETRVEMHSKYDLFNCFLRSVYILITFNETTT